ncbi:MAG: hypothetical protein ABI601_12365, partial [bacterium]
MSQIKIDVRELGASGASGVFGAKLDARAALAARDQESSVATNAAPSRSWFARGLRVVRNAAIAVAVMALVPVGLVVLRGDDLSRVVFRNVTSTAT